MKPMLASDAVEAKLKFPCIAQPKIDAVRGLNMVGALTGRSLKSHANIHTTNFFSMGAFRGFDGEMAAENEVHPDLCRITTSALSTITGEPWVMWHVFDYITEETKSLMYCKRLDALKDRVAHLQNDHSELAAHIRVVPSHWCDSLSELLELDEKFLGMGYEGTIVRDPYALHKQGRSTVREGGLLRIKRFIDAEAVITGFTEGETNTNEAQTNELGLQFRSTHAENMVKSGKIGNMTGRLLADVMYEGKVLFAEGSVVIISPGKLTAEEREFYFNNPAKLLGKISKFKFFPKGVKDKPRFPTHQVFRDVTDM